MKLIANATSEQFMAALSGSAGQPGDVSNANMEALSNNWKIVLEFRTALRQVLIATKGVPLIEGYKRNLRHENHNLNVTEGGLVVFATFNFADRSEEVQVAQLNALAMTSCAVSLTMLQTCHRSSRCTN